MDYLRWILLAAGIFLVLIIYLVGRKSRQHDPVYDYVEDDVAEADFNNGASDWRDIDECVGEVRIVAREKDDCETHDDYGDDIEDEDADAEDLSLSSEVQSDTAGDAESVIVLYVLAREPDRLAGDKINSAAQANGLKFGDMNIFHRIDDKQTVFSMANMVEPGVFDPESIYELETPGLTLFMQKSASSNNIVAFEDMLECAYHMSEMLGAQLCNRHRQPLTQSDADQYRELATGFDG